MSSGGGPKTIYIIRHGEKLGDPSSDNDDGPDLSIRGSARAVALPSLFLPATPELSCAFTGGSAGYEAQYSEYQMTGPEPRFSRPDCIFATKPSNGSKGGKTGTGSNRPVETIMPLAAALNLLYNDTCGDNQYQELAQEITSNPAYTGKVVLICWHHGKIQALAEQFGIKDAPAWEGTVFDRVWEITYNPGPVTLLDQPQQLLFGDSEK